MNTPTFKAIPAFSKRDYKAAMKFYLVFPGFPIEREHRIGHCGIS